MQANVWAAFFAVPFIANTDSDLYLAGQLQTVGNDAAPDYFNHGGASSGTVSAASRARSSVEPSIAALESALAAANAVAASVPPARAHFYAAHTLLQIKIALLSAQSIVALAEGVVNISTGNIAGATAAVSQSQDLVDAIFAEQRAAERGTQWHGIYMYDKLSNYGRARQSVHQLLVGLQVRATVWMTPCRCVLFSYRSAVRVGLNAHA